MSIQRTLGAPQLWLFGALLLGAQEDEASPRAVLVDPVHDVGKVDYGTEVEHTFSIRNEGDAPLELLSADSTCACAVLDYDEKIDPGETGSVRVLVKTEAQSGAFAVSIEAVTTVPPE